MRNPQQHPQWDMLPLELQQMLIKQSDMEDMEEHESDRRVDRFLDTLDADQIVTFRDLMVTIAGVHSNSYADFLAGRATSVAVYKHGLCGTCGQKHDIEELVVEEMSTSELADSLVPGMDSDNLLKVTELMKRYKVVPDGPDGGIAVRCVATEGCNKTWVSLDDRMRRMPGVDGCDYCQHTAAHG